MSAALPLPLRIASPRSVAGPRARPLPARGAAQAVQPGTVPGPAPLLVSIRRVRLVGLDLAPSQRAQLSRSLQDELVRLLRLRRDALDPREAPWLRGPDLGAASGARTRCADLAAGVADSLSRSLAGERGERR